MQLTYLDVTNFRSIGKLQTILKEMSVLVGPNNSGKTNILQALDFLLKKDKTNFDKERDFRLVNGKAQSPCTISAVMSGIDKEEVDLFPETVRKFAAAGNLFLKKTFELDTDSNKLNSSFTVSPTLEEKEVVELKKADEKQMFAQMLPDYHYIPPEGSLSNAEKMIKKLVGIILAESGLNNIKHSYEQMFESSELKKAMGGLEGEFSKFLERMWTNVGIRFQAAGKDFSALIGDSLTYDFVEGEDKVSVEMVGSGLQRSLMIGAFSVYAEHLHKQEQNGSESLTHHKQFFAIEEPELYLHPQLQRRLYEILQSISKRDQVILCTHSENLVRLEDYKAINLIRKNGSGTYVNFWKVGEDIPNAREQFLYITKIRPANEVFFARKVILVEGEAEMVTIPLLIQKLKGEISLDEMGLTIANCQGKTNIHLFEKVLNTFKIPYLAVYDKDSKRKENIEVNQEIKRLAEENNVGTCFVINPDFEKVLGVSNTQVNEIGKPQACYQHLQKLDYEQIHQDLRSLTTIILSMSN